MCCNAVRLRMLSSHVSTQPFHPFESSWFIMCCRAPFIDARATTPPATASACRQPAVDEVAQGTDIAARSTAESAAQPASRARAGG